MLTGNLKLNPDGTEFMLFGSIKQRDRLELCFLIDILVSPLLPAESVKNLLHGSAFSLPKNVQGVCKRYFIQLRSFRWVKQFLTHGASILVGITHVSCLLDYCNSLFRILSRCNLCKLQCIQNSSATIATNIN